MRVAYIAAGAADMYCGSCLRDNALARALRALGHDAILVPTYTPLRLDEESASEPRVYLGGVEVFLNQRFPDWGRNGGLLRRLLGSQTLLRWLGKLSQRTDPRRLGPLTVSILKGEAGSQERTVRELAAAVAGGPRPDVVHLTNSLFAGLARPLGRAARAPVVCGLQGEDLFLAGLPQPYREEALALIREHAAGIDRFVATSAELKERLAAWMGLERDRIDVVLPGIHLEDFETAAPEDSPAGRRPRTIGYLARIAPEKGLHLLAHAFRALAAGGEFPDLRLRIAGYLGRGERRYAAAVRRQLAAWGLRARVDLLGTLTRAEKIAFLRSLDVLAVPTAYPEAKGLFVLEALAAGVPVVEPRHGSFLEIVEATGGGLLHAPGDPADLAARLADVLRDAERRAQLAANGRAAVRERFTARRMAEETAAVYARVAAGASPPAAAPGRETGQGGSGAQAGASGLAGPPWNRQTEV
jgi:glycosyltransferase involved in cell wall biosynthesis